MSYLSLNHPSVLRATELEGTGYLGCLTDEQTTQLAKFILLMNHFFYGKGLEIPGLQSTLNSVNTDSKGGVNEFSLKELHEEMWRSAGGLSPDSILLRYLRARKFDVEKAFIMLLNSLYWRLRHRVQEILEKGESDIDLTQMNGKNYPYQFDKVGRPITYINARLHIRGSTSLEELEKLTIYNIETGRLFLQAPVEKATLVFDLNGFSLQNMDHNLVKFLVTSLQSYYPESLGLCLIVNAPWVFQGVWKVIKGWLDPVVQSKVVFCKESELEKYIDPSCLPNSLNKKNQYEFRFTPPTEKDIIHVDPQQKRTLFQAYFLQCQRFDQLSLTWAQNWIRQKATDALQGNQVEVLKHVKVPLREEVQVKLDQLVMIRMAFHQTELVPHFRAFDNYVRMPTYWHRMGVVSKTREGFNWDALRY